VARPYRRPDAWPRKAPAILQDITQTLQVTWTPHVFIELNDEIPAYLTKAWDQLSSVARTAQFLDLARQIETYAVSEVQASYLPGYRIGPLQQLSLSRSDAAEIRTAFSALLFGWSQTFLLAEALRLALAGQKVGQTGIVTWTREATTWNQAIIPTADVTGTGEVVRNVLAEARQSLGLGEPPEVLLVIGQWPRYLRLAWDDLKATVQSPVFAALRGQLIEQARQFSTRLPGDVVLDQTRLRATNFNPIQIQRVREILERWVFRLPTEITLGAGFREALQSDGAAPAV